MKYLMFCFSFLFGLLSCHVLYATQVHVLIASGKSSQAAIQKAIDLNAKQMKEELLQLREKLHVEVNIKELSGPTLSDASIREWITTRPLDKNDILFFYFTGKANEFREETEEFGTSTYTSYLWPLCNLPAKNEKVDLETYINKLCLKDNRLNIVIADCYTPRSSSSKAHKFLKISSMKEKAPNNEKSGYEALFLNSEGTLVLSAQTEASISWASPKGSLFTKTFLASLRKEVQLPHSSWKHLFKKTSDIYEERQKNGFVIKESTTESE
jgi:hypothetical protein